jgi:hypothetical protein
MVDGKKGEIWRMYITNGEYIYEIYFSGGKCLLLKECEIKCLDLNPLEDYCLPNKFLIGEKVTVMYPMIPEFDQYKGQSGEIISIYEDGGVPYYELMDSDGKMFDELPFHEEELQLSENTKKRPRVQQETTDSDDDDDDSDDDESS